MMERLIRITIPDGTDSIRIDKYLSTHVDIKTRSRAEYLIEKGCVSVNTKIVKSSYKLKPSDIIEIILPEPESEGPLQKLDLKLDVVFEDAHLIVINKPSGLVVHPAAGHQNDTLVNALLFHTEDLSMKFGEDRPGIVHRIDKETSGLLVIAKNDDAHQNLSEQFKNRSIKRIYEAVSVGNFQPKDGKITSFLARHPNDRKRYASVRDKFNKIITSSGSPQDPSVVGKWASTHFKVIASANGLSLMQLKLETGRTHQIRVHLSEKGFPILGDYTYGASSKQKTLFKELQLDLKKFERFFLHAKTLGFIHPVTQKELFFEVNWPDEERKFINHWIPL